MYTLDTEKVVLEGCMIVAFSGHSQYIRNPLDEKRVLEILEQRVGNMPCDFFLVNMENLMALLMIVLKK